MKQMLEVLEGIYEDAELRQSCIPLFLGNPGLGKTQIIKQFAKSKNAHVVERIGSTIMPNEVAGLAMPDDDTKLMTYFDFDAFLAMKDGDILLLDELLNTMPMVLNAMLTLLENRTLQSGKKLANIMIVAAANPQGASMLTPQIKQRFIWYDVKFDENLWGEYMYKKGLIDPILIELSTLIKNENFENSRYNYFTPRSIDRAIEMLIKGAPTPYYKDLSAILNKLVSNDTDQTIPVGDYNWEPNEKISWLDLKKKEYLFNKQKK